MGNTKLNQFSTKKIFKTEPTVLGIKKNSSDSFYYVDTSERN